MADPVAVLLDTLDLAPLGGDVFRGTTPRVGWQRVFGGQVVAQALAAAGRTVAAERACHSLHGDFLRPGDPAVPIDFAVERLRDGRSFSTRHVVARQADRPIFSMTASFHVAETGLEHAFPFPQDVPRPDALPDEAELKRIIAETAPDNVRRWFERERPIEFRPVDLSHYHDRTPLPARQHVWLRATRRLPDDPAIHRCVLAYLSDMTLVDTALFPHGRSVFDRDLQVASLDHAIWFHRDLRADAWLLHTQDSPATAGGRGFARGLVHDLEGRLVASTAQEGLIRPVPARSA